MRKLVLFLALMGGSVLFFGVAAPVASAGSCTSQVGVVGLTGSPQTNYFGWQVWCLGYIDKVEIGGDSFYGINTLQNGYGWSCVACYVNVKVWNTNAVGGGQSSLGVTSYWCDGSCGGSHRWCEYGVGNWYATPNPMAGYISFRIHQVSTNSWGDWHLAAGTDELHNVQC